MEPMTKDRLKELYYSMTNDELCVILGVSKMTLSTTLHKYNIPMKGSGNRTKRQKIKIIE